VGNFNLTGSANMPKVFDTIDGNEAVARVAYKLSDVIAIYPITPASPMGEWADQWAAENRPNLWDTIPSVFEMQSEAGAAGAMHGALQTGGLATTFTASQGLLLMIPNMFKIAGELTPFVMHVAARTLATNGLSIFGDHGDVMAARSAGFAMLASNTPQEAHDLALIAHAATLASRVPFLHFFDGFRTSHEIGKVEQLSDEVIRALVDEKDVAAHRARRMTPDNPFIRGTAQNPDVCFQSREACNPYYLAVPHIVQDLMERFGALTGRNYKLYEYTGAPDADRVIVIMGSGAEAVQEAIEHLNSQGHKLGVLKVRLFRPFVAADFVAALPSTVKAIAVLDRTKEPGCLGEPLYQDVLTALVETQGAGVHSPAQLPRIVGGRYGISSKEFTPGMVKAVFENLKMPENGNHFKTMLRATCDSAPVFKNHFTVGINDDVTHTSLPMHPEFHTEDPKTVRAVFYGLGSDGTVGANKNSIKIIGTSTDLHVQGYFVYDSKKSGSITTSHLRFGPNPIRSTYLISRANFVACHQFTLLDQVDVLALAEPGGTFLLNSPYSAEEVWAHLPANVQSAIVSKKLKFIVIDAYGVARQENLGPRINTVMQTCFFALSGVLPREQAIEAIKKAIKKSYSKMGDVVVEKNNAAVDAALAHMHEVTVPADAPLNGHQKAALAAAASDFIRNVTVKIIEGKGDELPVSALPVDGTFPSGTTKWEKRNIAQQIPVWNSDICIQCGKCVLVCPHAVIRGKLCSADAFANAPETFKTAASKWPDRKDARFALQVAPEDCTGCGLCVEVCPVKNKSQVGLKAINMEEQAPLLEAERKNWDFFLELPEYDRTKIDRSRVKDVQLLEPLFEFSGACSGCGETPYIKLMTQLFGDRAIVANATGCSSIYGGNLPTTPWTHNKDGRGPAWSNSLFEDNAEFGLGMRVTLDKQLEYATELVKKLEPQLGTATVEALLQTAQANEAEIAEQRERVAALKVQLTGINLPAARELAQIVDVLVKRSVWIIGGDGWAYDIGYGGLDHVIASGRNVNILVLDTEVYSNTGGQQSKSTPRGAVAKFAASGKPAAKKDLPLLALTYGNVYVARVAMGANDAQTLKAFSEAEAWNGPSLILAYSHCIAHGFNLVHGMEQQTAAVASGHWPLMRYNPAASGNKLVLDSKAPSLPLKNYIYNETRYTILAHSKPALAKQLLQEAQEDVGRRWRLYERLAAISGEINSAKVAAAAEAVAAPAGNGNGQAGEPAVGKG
jgi:pyruvate-ferredoxin/flavodoxin oxidoreductase